MSGNNNQNTGSRKTSHSDEMSENLAQTIQRIHKRLDLVANVANDIKDIQSFRKLILLGF